MKTTQQTTGNRAEDEALAFLTQKGMRLIQRNFNCYVGEIDLIMRDTTHIVFVEVRFRSRSCYGSAADSITPGKMKKIIRAATMYLQMKKWLYKVNSRFDVVAIDLTEKGKQITWLKNAFTT